MRRRPVGFSLALLGIAFAAVVIARGLTNVLPERRPDGLTITRVQVQASGPVATAVLTEAGGTMRWAATEELPAREVALPMTPAAFQELWAALRACRIDRMVADPGDPAKAGNQLLLEWPKGRVHGSDRTMGPTSAEAEPWQASLQKVDTWIEQALDAQRVSFDILIAPALTGRALQITWNGFVVRDSMADFSDGGGEPGGAVLMRVLPGPGEVVVRLRRPAGRGVPAAGQDPADELSTRITWDVARGPLKLDLREEEPWLEANPAGADPAPSDWAAHLQGFDRTVAEEHLAVVRMLDAVRQGAKACAMARWGLRHSPDHAELHARLGEVRTSQGWERDPTELGSQQDEPIDPELGAAARDRERRLRVFASRGYLRLGKRAWDGQRPDDARTAYLRALEYDGSDVTARERLGYRRVAIGAISWYAGEAGERRVAEFAQALADADVNEAHRSFDIEGAAAIPEQWQVAEAVRVLFRRLLQIDAKRPDFPQPMQIRMLATDEEWARFVEANYPEADWDYSKTSVGANLSYGDVPCLTGKMGQADREWKLDATVHMVVHALAHYAVDRKDLPIWFSEGLGYVFQLTLFGDVKNYCIPGTAQAEQSTSALWTPQAWRSLLRSAVVSQQDVRIEEVVGSSVESMSVEARAKTFSLVDYLLADRPADVAKYLEHLRAGDSGEAALEAAFGGAHTLDQAWREWVEREY